MRTISTTLCLSLIWLVTSTAWANPQHDGPAVANRPQTALSKGAAATGPESSTSPAAATAPLESTINQRVAARIAKEEADVAGLTSDAEFLRRITLDLAGRTPTAAEIQAFATRVQADPQSARSQWVDLLLASPDFDYHLRNELDRLFLADIRQDNKWRDYLLEANQQGKTFEDLFREMLLPEYTNPQSEGAAAFLRERVRDLDTITNDTSVLFFGINISCAKCHDHPLVADWQQAHYYGMASFFKRSYVTKKGFLAERFDGQMKFTTVAGEEKDAKFMFLNGSVADEPAESTSLAEDELKKINELIQAAEREQDAKVPPLPDFSPRKQLVSLSTAAEGRKLLAQNLVNRTWARLLGRGLVHPLDQIHSSNPASHPELLRELTEDTIAHDFDIRRLVRGIVLSEPYQRSSHWTADTERPAPELFAVATGRALTPWQMSLALAVATMAPDRLTGVHDAEKWPDSRKSLEGQVTRMTNVLEIPPQTGFQIGVDEALFFSNSDRFSRDYLSRGADRIVGHLLKIEDQRQLIESAFLNILNRVPLDTERDAIGQYLSDRPDRKEAAVEQVVWVLLNSPEFRFNH